MLGVDRCQPREESGSGVAGGRRCHRATSSRNLAPSTSCCASSISERTGPQAAVWARAAFSSTASRSGPGMASACSARRASIAVVCDQRGAQRKRPRCWCACATGGRVQFRRVAPGARGTDARRPTARRYGRATRLFVDRGFESNGLTSAGQQDVGLTAGRTPGPRALTTFGSDISAIGSARSSVSGTTEPSECDAPIVSAFTDSTGDSRPRRAAPRCALRVLVAAAEILEHDHRGPGITESPRDRPSQLAELPHLARQEHRACRRPTRERGRVESADGRRCVHEKRHVFNDGGKRGAARSSSGRAAQPRAFDLLGAI